MMRRMKHRGRFVQRMLLVCGLAAFGLLVAILQAAPPVAVAEAGGSETMDGMTVPDVGTLPTVVPIPPTNLNYAAKIDLGK